MTGKNLYMYNGPISSDKIKKLNDDYIIVEEKIDGSQITFLLDDDEVNVYSRKKKVCGKEKIF